MRALRDFVEALDGADEMEALNRVFQSAIEQRGMKTFGYARIGATRFDAVTTAQFHEQCVKGTTYPGEWRDRYRARGYFAVDPIIAACRTRLMPIVWDRLELCEDVPEQSAVLGEAGEFGLTRGFSVPIHTPSGDKAIVSLASDESEAAFRSRIEAFQHQFHLMALHFHARVETTLAALVPAPEPTVKLTPREIECLQWTAEGKTAWEISRILSISEYTVNFHLKNSMAKLDVHSKTHAVAKAVSLGFGPP